MKDPSLHIERYINGSLSEAHKAEFEAALLHDAHLQALLGAHKSLRHLIEAQRLRQKVAQTSVRSRLRRRVRRWRLFVVAVVFLSAAGIVQKWLNKETTPQNLDTPQLKEKTWQKPVAAAPQAIQPEITVPDISAKNYGLIVVKYIKEPFVSIVRGDDASSNALLSEEAEAAFVLKKYSKAAKLLEDDRTIGNHMHLLFLRAAARLRSAQYAASASDFDRLKQFAPQYAAEAEWNLLLCRLAQSNSLTTTKQKLAIWASDPEFPYRESAKELLAELNL